MVLSALVRVFAHSARVGERVGRLSGERDLAASRIAARKRSLVTSEQLVACGFGRDAVAHRVKAGRLHVVFTGVYSMGCGVLPPMALELAALLACGKRTFLSHRSGAFVWGMRETPPAEVEVSVVGRECKSRKGIRVHRIKEIDKGEIVCEQGLWVSSAARVVLEVAAVGSKDELIDVIDAGLALRKFTPGELKVALERHRPRRGRRRLCFASSARRGLPCRRPT